MAAAKSTSTTQRRKFIKPRHKRVAAGWMTWAVVVLQACLLVTLAVAPRWNPPRGQFFEVVWAWMHKPSFYPFVALLVIGPVLSFLASQIKGMHRWWLLITWSAFFIILVNFFGDRVMVMGRMLWWRYLE